jgi:hypothetical protein
MIISKYVSSKWLLVHLAVALSVIIKGGLFRAQADEDAGDLFNYSFAVWVGSGIYKVSDANKRFAVLRVPAAYTFRPAQYDKSAFPDKLGFRLLLPAIIAFEEETDTNFQFGAGAFVPGLEVQIPVNKYWTLKPFGQFGAGKDTAGGDLRYIYGGGARSLISFTWEKFVFDIGNSLILAEDRNSTEDESSGFLCWKPAWTCVTRSVSASVVGNSMQAFSSWPAVFSTGWILLWTTAPTKE